MIEKLKQIQAELKAPKGQFNSFGKYKYRSCEDILEAVKPYLKAVGCVLTLSDDVVAIGDRVYVKATATLTDENKEIKVTAFAREEETKKGMDASQITGTASSYARKYALNGLFCIDDTKDADTDEFSKRTKETPTKKATNIEKKTFKDMCELLKVDSHNILKQVGITTAEQWSNMTAEEHAKCMIILKEIEGSQNEVGNE